MWEESKAESDPSNLKALFNRVQFVLDKCLLHLSEGIPPPYRSCGREKSKGGSLVSGAMCSCLPYWLPGLAFAASELVVCSSHTDRLPVVPPGRLRLRVATAGAENTLRCGYASHSDLAQAT